MNRFGPLSGLLLGLVLANGAFAQEVCEPVVGRVASLEGTVEVERAGSFVWQPAALEQPLCEADSVRVGPRSRAALRLVNDAVLRLDENTTLQLTDIRTEPEERSFLQLVAGVIQSFSRKPRLLAIDTPYLNATIEGTEFVVTAVDGQGSVTVFEGIVSAANPQGEVRLAAGEAAVAAAGEPPVKRIVVRPREAVQWALYYPPILAAVGGQAEAGDLPPALAEAMRRADQGDLAGAFATLDAVPEAERDALYHVYRAALLLSVGRVEEADAAIARALAEDQGSGLGYAQRAIIELVQNREADALASARRAVELSPEAAAPKIALSYAQQANFELEAARDTLLQAVEQQPQDALAWARLSELWLMLGDRGRAREAAARAVALAPEVERTQITLGFADLVEFRTGAAKQAFERAIELAPADPLPRLGLGLAQIREGDLEQGRENLEVAVGLNGTDALLRAYLGKAYFEEKRDDIANEQYGIAQELDPLDPTAYLYEAIKLQTENQPVEALDSLRKSIELNDNRAVYRSRLLLDEDRAARGTSLARVYQDLGFDQVAVDLSTASITQDPSNPAAHRFLSDSYVPIRRREISRVSELLQAQLLQDININPVQPSLSETNLNIVARGGPVGAGLNEYNPLFERNQVQVNTTGMVGNNETLGAEGVASAIHNNVSVSAGAFSYSSDGWRDNGSIDQDIQDVFAQWAITPELNAQVEVRHRDTNNGDLEQRFDRSDFDDTVDREIDQNTGRIGLRYSPLPNSDFLFSYIYNDRQEGFDQTQSGIFPGIPGVVGPLPFTSPIENDLDDRSHQVEGQYIYKQNRFNLVTGGAFAKVDRHLEVSTQVFGLEPLEPIFPGVSDPVSETQDSDITHPRGYVYGNLNFPEPVTWTVGLSYDDYKEDDFHEQKVNPKVGVRWNVFDNLQFRAAWFQTLKPALANNQTLEPTQIAGFNQFFDDVNATKSTRYGFGLDHQLTPSLSVGAEATWRDLDEPLFFGNDAIKDKRDEQTHRGYVYWAPWSELALSAEVVYDRFKAQAGGATSQLSDVPEKVTTISVPAHARYFWKNGLFAGAGVTYVYQDVSRFDTSTFNEGHDHFVVVDATAGYRFPNRFGVFSLGVQNVFDRNFNFQDDSYREFRDEPSTGPYIPDFQIVARLTLNLDFFGGPPFSGRD